MSRSRQPQPPDTPAPRALLDLDIADATTVSAARRQLTAALTAGHCRTTADDVALTLSELATNGLHHGDPPVHAHACIQHDTLVLTVVDHGPGLENDPHPGTLPDPQATRGRGLWLVRQLAASITFSRTADGFRAQATFPCGRRTT